MQDTGEFTAHLSAWDRVLLAILAGLALYRHFYRQKTSALIGAGNRPICGEATPAHPSLPIVDADHRILHALQIELAF